MAVYQSIISDYGASSGDIRVLQAKIHLCDIRGLVGGAEALDARRRVYASIIDLPTDQVLVPEAWRYRNGRRLPRSEWEALRGKSIAFVRKGATGALVTSYLSQAKTVTERLAILRWMSGLRPDNEIYQDHIAHLVERLSEADLGKGNTSAE